MQGKLTAEDCIAPASGPRQQVRSLAVWGGLALLALAANGTSLWNGYTLDDSPIVEHNVRVHTLSDPWNFFVTGYWPRELGGSLYRPLSIIRFAIEWAAGGGSPMVFHAVNILLCVVLTFLVYAIAKRYLRAEAAFVAAAFFAVHPVHVDAVGNVVGQSELAVALCLGGGVLWYLHIRERPELRLSEALGLFVLTIIAALSKENGILLPALLAAAEVTVVRDARPWRARARSLAPTAVLLALAIGLVLAARKGALGALVGEHPILALSDLTFGQRTLTMLRLVLEWARLLVWPAHLQAEYGPPALDGARTFGLAQAAGLVVLGGAATIAFAARRARPAITFGILWTGIAILPVSNFAVATGILLAERTLFLASMGATIALGGIAGLLWERMAHGSYGWRLAGVAAAGILIVLGGTLSAKRQLVWRDNATLFAQGIVDAPDTYRSWYQYGRFLAAQSRGVEARRALERAASLYPRDGGVFEDLGQVVRIQSGCGEAIPLFERAIAAEPRRKDARGRLYSCLMGAGDTARARVIAEEGAKLGEWYFQLVMARAAAQPGSARP
jgi:tetratricopeptide (TPR) repeat protein